MAALLVVVATSLAACTARAQNASEHRVAGEHGLWVRVQGDSVLASWITPAAVAGVLEARTEEGRIARVRTPVGFTHTAAFRPGDATAVTLAYGSAESGQPPHRTEISLLTPERPPVVVTGVDSLYVVGDTHGYYDALVEGLQAAGLIDDELRWSGGQRHLVLAGDLTDRGPDVLGLLWLVYRLEREAEADGGGVHVVLGNHEIMVMMGDLRYVHPKELHIADLYEVGYDRMFDVRSSILGRWLASKPGLMRVDGVLIAHGGLGERYAGYSLQEYEDTLRTFTGEELFARWADLSYIPPLDSLAAAQRDDFFWHRDSAFWHREYVQTDTVADLLGRVLDRMESEVFVVGHTPVNEIEPRYDGRLIPAHTPSHGAELLLLVREEDRYRRYRVSARGHEPF
jgi:hypothetical protein